MTDLTSMPLDALLRETEEAVAWMDSMRWLPGTVAWRSPLLLTELARRLREMEAAEKQHLAMFHEGNERMHERLREMETVKAKGSELCGNVNDSNPGYRYSCTRPKDHGGFEHYDWRADISWGAQPVHNDVALDDGRWTTNFSEPVEQWLATNRKADADVMWGRFPLGMVQRWMERAEEAEHELSLLRANSVRLDWLQERLRADEVKWFGASIGLHGDKVDFSCETGPYNGHSIGIHHKGATLRAAIDAAIQAGQQETKEAESGALREELKRNNGPFDTAGAKSINDWHRSSSIEEPPRG